MTTESKTNPVLIDMPMPIVTPRLIIRSVMPGDGAEIHAAKRETWEDIRRWMPWAKEIGTAEETEANCREAYARFLMREDFRMVAIDRASNKIALMTGLHRFDWAIRRIEIGFWARKEFQGRGLVTESTIALARYAFNALNARTVAICHAEGNEASRKVIERVGFHYEGCLRNETLLPDGSIRDKHWYSHVNSDDLPPLDVSWK